MGSENLKAGVIGVGWAGQQHIRAYQSLPDTSMVAIAEPNASLRDKIATEFGIEHTFSDYSEMLASGLIDVVSIGTPNFAHADPAIAALDAGIHVLVEKPLARSYAEGKRMVDAAKRNDRVLQVMFNQRYRSDVEVVKAFVDEGGVGEVYHAKSRWLRRNGIPGGEKSWFVQHELSGGGPLIDLGVHMLDMALYLLGEPEVVSVSGATYDRLGQRFVKERFGEGAKYEVEDFGTAFVRLAGGRTLALEASWATYREDGDLMNVVLYGDTGGAEMATRRYDPTHSVRFYVDAGGVPSEIVPEVPRQGRIPGHERAAALFVEHIQSGDYSNHRGEEGLLRTWILDAIYRSAREGREIPLSELERERSGS